MIKSFRILLLIIVTITIISCSKEISFSEISEINNIKSDSTNSIILGDKLENPYTIRNMQKAYDSLIIKGNVTLVVPTIRASHYYIKFSPASFEEYLKLKNTDGLILFEYPLDFEILKTGNSYHENSLPDSVPTYQYSVVQDLNVLNKFEFEILDSLYIPEQDTLFLKEDFSNRDFIDKMLDQAYIQTGNYNDTIKHYNEGDFPHTIHKDTFS